MIFDKFDEFRTKNDCSSCEGIGLFPNGVFKGFRLVVVQGLFKNQDKVFGQEFHEVVVKEEEDPGHTVHQGILLDLFLKYRSRQARRIHGSSYSSSRLKEIRNG